jgi:mRNA interferase RelE/StbE
VKEALRALGSDPLAGEPLERELEGLRRYRVRRFRIVYRTNPPRRTIEIFAIGDRRTIYENLAESLRGRG